jgi:dihydrofolate reductase
MRKLIVTEYLTLDGVMEDPGGGERFKGQSWSFPFWSDEAGRYKFDELFAADALLLGRKTYEGFARAWPSVKDDVGFADRMNGMPKYVVSTTLEQPQWNNTTVIRNNVIEAVSQLKQQPEQAILVAGSGALVQTLMHHQLIDEYRLMIHPVMVGAGKRFFRETIDRSALKLVESKVFKSGIVVLHYQPDETHTE